MLLMAAACTRVAVSNLVSVGRAAGSDRTRPKGATVAEKDERDDYQRNAPENEGRERPQYHHDARRGETRYPPQSGSQHSGRPGHDEPHSALNQPVAEIEAEDEWQRVGRRDSVADPTGMGRPQTSDTRGSDGDPVMRDNGEREAHNPAQMTPRGVTDAEQEAMRRAEERTGVPLTADEPPEE
jgi:hypothetical protein